MQVLTPTAFSVPNDLKLIDHCLFRDSHVLALIEAKKTGLTDLVAIKMETVQQHSSDRMTCDPPTDLEVRTALLACVICRELLRAEL